METPSDNPVFRNHLDIADFVKRRVHECYWRDNINCATANLKILSEVFQINLSSDLIDAAVGMHGAGKYGAQCGLVEGSLMFIGVLGRRLDVTDSTIASFCKDFAGQFVHRFGSLSGEILRPEGFGPDNPPHLCEKLTCEVICFAINAIANYYYKLRNLLTIPRYSSSFDP